MWWVDVEGARTLDVPQGRQGYVLALTGPVQAGAAKLQTGEGAEVQSGVLPLDGHGAVLWIDLPRPATAGRGPG